MTLTTAEFMRRFLLHVLPGRFHRIRHYGLPKSRHPAPRIADPCAACDGSIANAIAPNRISPVQIPIAPRRC